MKKLRFYLAHPFPERFRIRVLELEIEKKLDILLWNPFYDGWEALYIKRLDIENMSQKHFSDFLKKNAKKIVELDLKAIQESDAMIAILPYPSIGVSMEIHYCSHVLNKPVLIYQPEMIYARFEKHPWLLYYGKVYKTLPGLIKGIKSLKKKIENSLVV